LVQHHLSFSSCFYQFQVSSALVIFSYFILLGVFKSAISREFMVGGLRIYSGYQLCGLGNRKKLPIKESQIIKKALSFFVFFCQHLAEPSK
jgi:hypothetical protein